VKESLDFARLEVIAEKLRRNIVKMVAAAGSGHNGGSLSAIDVITYLYFHQMQIDPTNPRWPDRDRFVLSKGHCAPSIYVALAERGYFPEEVLWTLRDIESKLQGHPDMKKTPGIDMTTGSLGQGISSAVGIAIAAKLDGKGYKVFAMVGDGELQEGQVWEAALAAAHYKLDNLIVIVDDNKLETDGPTASIVNVQPIAPKWEAFGWNAHEINGHDFAQIHQAVGKATVPNGKPTVIVADTVKGKGVSFMENVADWHSGPTTPDQTEQALRELDRQAGALFEVGG
jgi:transketolase